MSEQLEQALSDLEEGTALKLVQERLDSGDDPMTIVADCREGMARVGKRYEDKEYYVSDLIMAAEIFKQAVMDVILEETLAAIKKTKPSAGGIGGAWLGGWRSASALVAPKLWDRFVWPYLVPIVNAMIDQGMIPILHWDQDWTRDLARLQELPAKKCILNPDGMTDMRKFKELASDRMAMLGDVPASLLAAGTPDDVRNYVRDRVELFEGKGLLICPGCDAPIDAKVENMEALVQAAYDYGTIRS